MRQHRALGLARGARGVEDHGGVFGVDMGGTGLRVMCGQGGVVSRFVYGTLYAKPMLDLCDRIRRGQFGRDIGVVDQQHGATVVQDMCKFGRAFAHVDRNGDGPQAQGRHQDDQEFGRVARHQRHAVALLHTVGRQPCGHGPHLGVKSFVGQPDIVADQRLATGVAVHGLLQHVVQVRRPVGKAFQPLAAKMCLARDPIGDL